MLWQRGNGTLRAAERASVSRRPEPEGGAVPALWLSGAAARDCSFLSPAGNKVLGAAQSDRAAPGWSWLSGFWRPRPSSRFLTPPHVVRLRPTDWAGDQDLGVPARLPGPLHFLSRGVVLQRVHLSYAAHLPPGLGYLAGSSGPNLRLLLPGALANLLYPASVYLQPPLGVAPEHLRIT